MVPAGCPSLSTVDENYSICLFLHLPLTADTGTCTFSRVSSLQRYNKHGERGWRNARMPAVPSGRGRVAFNRL